MKIIEKDPNIIIPDICEADLDHKMILSSVIKGDSHFLSIITKNDGFVYAVGCDINYSDQDLHRWSDLFNRDNRSLIEFMKKEYISASGACIRYIVIENSVDLAYTLLLYTISKEYAQEIINHWKKLNFESGDIQ